MKTSTKLIAVGIAALVVGIGGGIGFGYLINVQKSLGAVDIKYGGQYYPGEFLLQGYPQFWDTYGLNVDHRLFTSGGANNDALIAGEVDINCGSDSKTVALFTTIPDDALVIGTIQRGDRYSTIVRSDATYTDWGDLVGQTVGTKLGTGAEQVLRRYFDSQPYTWEDFTWINAEVTDLPAMLESEEIEAFTAWEPTPSISVDSGVGKVLMNFGAVALTPASLHTTKDFAYNNPGLVIKFLAAHFDKYAMIVNDTSNAADIASDAAETFDTTISSGAFELIFNKINFQIDFDETIISAINDTAYFLLDKDKIDAVPDIVWDTRFVEAAKELYLEYGTPATGLSVEQFDHAIVKLTEKYFGIIPDSKLFTGVFIGSCVLGTVVILRRRKS